nr:hypothetical protein [Tanacetum cinerariifolium]
GWSGTLVGQGSTVIVIGKKNYLPRAYLTVITFALFESYRLAGLVDYTCPYLATSCIYYAKARNRLKISVDYQMHCVKVFIFLTVHPELPDRNSRIRNSPTDKIGVCTRSCAASMVLFQPWYYDLDENCYPTFWLMMMDLFSFINYVNPTKVQIGERAVIEGEVLLLQLTRGRVFSLAGVNDQEHANVQGVEDEVPVATAEKPKVQRKRKTADGASGSRHPPKKLKDDQNTSGHDGASTGGKSLAAIQELFEQNDEVTFIIRSLVSPPPLMIAAIDTTVIAGATFVLVFRVGAEPVPQVCRSMVDQLAPPRFFSQLRGLEYEQLFAEFNVGVARQACLNAEVRLRSEHIYTERKMFKRRCVGLTGLLKDRDAKVVSLKVQLSLKEAEAAEAIHLHGQIATVEAIEAAWVSELDGLKERNAVLERQVAALDSTAIIKDTKLASSNTQIAKMTQDLSNLQLSCDELSIKSSSLESDKDKLIDQVSKLEG